jgi:hypothetical protein
MTDFLLMVCGALFAMFISGIINFNDIERMSKIKQEIICNPSKEAQLIAEVTMLTEAVRVLADRVKELESR